MAFGNGNDVGDGDGDSGGNGGRRQQHGNGSGSGSGTATAAAAGLLVERVEEHTVESGEVGGVLKGGLYTLHSDKCIIMLALSMTIAIIVAKKSVTQKPIVEIL